MRIGLGLNVGEGVGELVAKGVEAERLGLDTLWVGDLPGEAYAPVMAAALAEDTGRIRIGLGLVSPLLHRPSHIASMVISLVEGFGPRFELCIGPGDRRRLCQVGVPTPREVIKRVATASKVIREKLERHGVEVPLWLGAQGPRMVAASTCFDGVLLNLPSLRMIRWALKIIQEREERVGFKTGVFAVSYIHRESDEEVLRRALRAASLVAGGASPSLLKEFGYWRSGGENHSKRDGPPSRKISRENMLREFSIIMRDDEFARYLSHLESLGIGDVVLAYPQNYSLLTIREACEAVNRYKRESRGG